VTTPITLYGSTRPIGSDEPGTPIEATGDTYDAAPANLKALVRPPDHEHAGPVRCRHRHT
jgi:hypothetical protein